MVDSRGRWAVFTAPLGRILASVVTVALATPLIQGCENSHGSHLDYPTSSTTYDFPVSAPVSSQPGQIVPDLDCNKILEGSYGPNSSVNNDEIQSGSVPSSFTATTAVWCRPNTIDEQGNATKPGVHAGTFSSPDDIDTLRSEDPSLIVDASRIAVPLFTGERTECGRRGSGMPPPIVYVSDAKGNGVIVSWRIHPSPCGQGDYVIDFDDVFTRTFGRTPDYFRWYNEIPQETQEPTDG